MSTKRVSLVGVIGRDLRNHAKLVVLLLLILFSALAVVLTTHNTRLLTMQHDALCREQRALDSEWRNLLLEEKVLGDSDRIERLAIKKLKMQYPTPEQEAIVKYPK